MKKKSQSIKLSSFLGRPFNFLPADFQAIMLIADFSVTIISSLAWNLCSNHADRLQMDSTTLMNIRNGSLLILQGLFSDSQIIVC